MTSRTEPAWAPRAQAPAPTDSLDEPRQPRRLPLDVSLGVVLALAAAVGCWTLSRQVPVALYDLRNSDVYFQADVGRVYWNIVLRSSDHYRTSVHPLFSLITHPTFVALANALRIDMSDLLSPAVVGLVRGMGAGVAGAAMAALWTLLRLCLVRRMDSVLFCGLAAVSSFGLFWFAVPETYPWGAAGILLALAIVALGCHRHLSIGWYVLAGTLTLAFTTTNWMVGCLAMASRYDLRRAVQWSVNVFFIVTLLWGAQRALFRTSKFFLQLGEEKAFVLRNESGGLAAVTRSFLVHGVVTPQLQVTPDPEEAQFLPPFQPSGKTGLTTQFSPIGSGGIWGWIGTASWLILLAVGAWAAITLPDVAGLRFTLGLAILGQHALHSVYGEETFLYAAHFGPMLVVLAALGARTRLRPLVLGLTCVTFVCLSLNNVPKFREAMAFVGQTQQRLDRTHPIDPAEVRSRP